MDSKRNEEMETEREMQEDVVIVGTGAAGLFAALNLPRDRKTFWMIMHLPERAPTPDRVSCSMRM